MAERQFLNKILRKPQLAHKEEQKEPYHTINAIK